MNIFYLAEGPWECARYHCDKHVLKMILEYAQLMSTAHRILDADRLSPGFDEVLYKTTHKNHPSAVWVRQSKENYLWLHELWVALCQEYGWRYGKVHATYTRLKDHIGSVPLNIPAGEFTPPPQAMPDEYKRDDTVEAYRAYYRGGKTALLVYKNSNTPGWISQ